MVSFIRMLMLPALLLLTAATGYANVGRDYGESIRALSKQDWERAELKIRSALAENDQPQESIEISGGIRFPYMPWYVLGSALQGQGDCAGAVEAWNRSLEVGVVKVNEREFGALKEGMEKCQEQLAAAGNDDSTAKEILEVADNENERQAENDRSAQLLAQQAEVERRKDELDRRNRLNKARRDLHGVLDRAALAISEEFGNDAVVEARVRLVALSNASTSLLTSDSIDLINRQIQEFQDGIRDYARTAQEWRAEQQAIAHRTPPPSLRQIAELYFDGDYLSVSSSADPDLFDDRRQKVQALLFRSAAQFNLYWLGGEKDPDLLENARGDARSIKELNQAFRPYVVAFSPKFLSFFDDA